MPSPQGPDDVRFRRKLDEDLPAPNWPDGYHLKPMNAERATDLHRLLMAAFDDENPDFDAWWTQLSSDAEYDPGLCFLLYHDRGALAAAAQCWTSGFIKDLATAPEHRGMGLGEALVLHAFRAFKRRGAPHVDLKTSLAENAAAVRLYRRLGMVEVEWDG